ncbi:MAG: biotin transporter BioY [Kineosporiaceae bacterium]
MARRRLPAQDLALVAVFAAFIAALGAVPGITVAGSSVPVTAQTLGVMLAGAVLGARRGGLAVLTFLGLVALGLPVLSGGRGGLDYLLSRPSTGFLWGWVAGAVVIGAMVERRPRRWRDGWIAVSCLVGGLGVVYVFGVVGMAWVQGITLAKAWTICLVFVPGDLMKAALTTVLAGALLRGYPPLMERTERRDGEDELTAAPADAVR